MLNCCWVCWIIVRSVLQRSHGTLGEKKIHDPSFSPPSGTGGAPKLRRGEENYARKKRQFPLLPRQKRREEKYPILIPFFLRQHKKKKKKSAEFVHVIRKPFFSRKNTHTSSSSNVVVVLCGISSSPFLFSLLGQKIRVFISFEVVKISCLALGSKKDVLKMHVVGQYPLFILHRERTKQKIVACSFKREREQQSKTREKEEALMNGSHFRFAGFLPGDFKGTRIKDLWTMGKGDPVLIVYFSRACVYVCVFDFFLLRFGTLTTKGNFISCWQDKVGVVCDH